MSVSNLETCNHAYNGDLAGLRADILRDNSLVDLVDKNNRSPLHWACSSGQSAVVKFLINSGVKVRIVKKNQLLQLLLVSDANISPTALFYDMVPVDWRMGVAMKCVSLSGCFYSLINCKLPLSAQ